MNRNIKTMIIGFICATTMTSCAFQFGDAELPVKPEDLNSIAEIIDNTDLTQNSEVAELQEEIVNWANDLNAESGEFQSAHLERVVDGDTIVVDIDGESYKVRLIGINTPESVASKEYLERTGKENTSEGKEASEYTKEILADVDTVFLQMDVSDTDRYDRLLRYVWLELPDDPMNQYEIETKMLNAILLKDGVAEVEIYKPDEMYADTFKQIETER